jgi:hypothetical protein
VRDVTEVELDPTASAEWRQRCMRQLQRWTHEAILPLCATLASSVPSCVRTFRYSQRDAQMYTFQRGTLGTVSSCPNMAQSSRTFGRAL